MTQPPFLTLEMQQWVSASAFTQHFVITSYSLCLSPYIVFASIFVHLFPLLYIL